jgi:hypothetical protein
MRDELDALGEENARLKKQAQLAEKYKEKLIAVEKTAEKVKVCVSGERCLNINTID